MGRKVGGGSGWGTHIHPWWIHVNVWQNQCNIAKKINKTEKKLKGMKEIYLKTRVIQILRSGVEQTTPRKDKIHSSSERCQ